MAESGLPDEKLLKRLSAIYGEALVAGVAKELADARTVVYTSEGGMDEATEAIHKRFTYRMQDFGEFMKSLLQCFTQWFNRTHTRTGTLWEDRFKSVIVEDGVVARTISAYIDLNPVRAGMMKNLRTPAGAAMAKRSAAGRREMAKGTGRSNKGVFLQSRCGI